MVRLVDYHWPGNVRELENIIERAIILTEGRRLQLDEAFDLNVVPEITAKKTLREVEQEMIRSALKDCAWKIEGDRGAATRLAMAPSTLRERIKKYGLERYGSDAVTATDPVQID
jgi:transcriptional regulator of acetoin/glycerol metabolism